MEGSQASAMCALAPSAALVKSGWSKALEAFGGRAAAIAAGGLLAMLTDALMPYAMQKGGDQAGIWTVVGFVGSPASS